MNLYSLLQYLHTNTSTHTHEKRNVFGIIKSKNNLINALNIEENELLLTWTARNPESTKNK